MIERPEVEYDDATHTYTLGGQTLAGVSSVAKIGGAEDTWGIASAWGFRIGYEGSYDLMGKHAPWDDKDELRAALKARGLTPWSKRDQAAARGNWVHDALEALANTGTIPDLNKYKGEIQGHVKSLIGMYAALQPEFVATEVQVASVTHGFAGRYDLRAKVDARRLLPCIDQYRTDASAARIREAAANGETLLGLLDLKTSKGIYPTTHFPQLEGYELAGVEMGYPETDFRAVINTTPEGRWDLTENLGVSWATAEDFVGLLAAFRAIRRIKALDPEIARKRAEEDVVLAQLPSTARDIAGLELPELAGKNGRSIAFVLSRLRKQGRAEKDGSQWLAV